MSITSAGDVVGRNGLDNNTARDEFTDVLARVQSQLADIAVMQQQQAALSVSAAAADQTVEVTVNAQGQLIKVVIDESYLDDHDFEDLGESILQAARTAAQDAGRQVAQLLAPMGERYKSLPSFSDLVEGATNISDLMPDGFDWPAAPQGGTEAFTTQGPDGGDSDEGPELTVKR